MKVKDVAMSVKSTFESSQGKGFSLKQLAVLCNVTKRRLYDIVNVLEVFELVKTVRYNDGKYVYFLGLDKDKLIALFKYRNGFRLSARYIKAFSSISIGKYPLNKK